MRVALYARVSTTDQTTANQLIDLRQYADARGWKQVVEYSDPGVSGSKSCKSVRGLTITLLLRTNREEYRC